MDWQTLVTGAFALVAAWCTVRPLRNQIVIQQRQIDLQKEQFDAEQASLLATAKSKNWAARAQLPDALSSVGAYAAACLSRIVNDDGAEGGRPDIPYDAMDAIKKAIEHADPDSAKAIYDLVVLFQIHNSRFGRADALTRPNERVDRGYDSVLLRCLCDRLFTYARNEEDAVTSSTLTRQMMTSALTSCVGIDRFLDRNERIRGISDLIVERHPE